MRKHFASLVLGALMLLSPVPDTAQSITNSWGDQVEGGQLQIALSTNSPQQNATAVLASGLPRLEMKVRNIGKDALTFNFDALSHSSTIEIDGTWYAPQGAAGNDPRRRELAPGSQSVTIPIFFQTTLVQLDATGARLTATKLELKSGKHSIRIKTPVGARGVQNSAKQVITLISNVITIDVP